MYKRREPVLKNTFQVELTNEETDETFTLNIYQPKVSLIRKLSSLSKGEDSSEIIDNMLDILAKALSNNESRTKISADFLADALDTDDMSALFEDYFGWVEELKKKVKIPQLEYEKSDCVHQYTVSTGEYKIVADYANMSIPDVLELNLSDYLEYYRDAVIYNNMRSKEGMERLDNAWILEQTKPDRNALRELLEKR